MFFFFFQNSHHRVYDTRPAGTPRPSTMVARPSRVEPEEWICSAGPIGEEKVTTKSQMTEKHLVVVESIRS